MEHPADKRKLIDKIQEMEVNHFNKPCKSVKPSSNIERCVPKTTKKYS